MSAPNFLSSTAERMPQPEQCETEADEPSAPSPELISKVQLLLSNIELLDIRPCSITGSIEQGVIPGARVASVKMDLAMSFAANEGVYGNRFDYTFELKGDADQDCLGKIEFSLLLDYDVTEGFMPELEAAEFVTSTTGYFAAYPYARELFQSLAARLQFDPIILGLIKRDSIRPGSISVVPHRTPEA